MQCNKELAQAILEAARKREASFDHSTAACRQADGQMADLSQLYGMSIREAAEADGVNPFLSFPVYLLLTTSWNDALDWATLNAEK